MGRQMDDTTLLIITLVGIGVVLVIAGVATLALAGKPKK